MIELDVQRFAERNYGWRGKRSLAFSSKKFNNYDDGYVDSAPAETMQAKRTMLDSTFEIIDESPQHSSRPQDQDEAAGFSQTLRQVTIIMTGTIFGRYYKQLDGLVSKPKLRILCMIGTMTMSAKTKTSKTAATSLVSITSHALMVSLILSRHWTRKKASSQEKAISEACSWHARKKRWFTLACDKIVSASVIDFASLKYLVCHA